jgi:GNAT superfamily N-acetyltransferase
MSTAISIRPATPDDVPLIAALIKELAEYEHCPDEAKATTESLRQNLFGNSFPGEVSRRGPVAECLIGELNGSPEGLALFFTNYSTWTGVPGIYLEDLFVRPAARARGLGKALLGRLAAIATSRGCQRLEWAVLDWNTPAIDFYKSLGAQPLSEWTVFRLSGTPLENMAGTSPDGAPSA